MSKVRIKELPIVVERPQYDPNKNYEWSADIEVVLTGREFEALVNANRIAQQVLGKLFIDGVQAGLITEAKEQVKDDEPKYTEEPQPVTK